MARPRRARSHERSISEPAQNPYLSQGYPDRFDALLNDLSEHKREIDALIEILQSFEQGLKRRLIRHFLILQVFIYAGRARQLVNEIQRVSREIIRLHERHRLRPPLQLFTGSTSVLAKIEHDLKPARDRVIAHRFEDRSGNSLSLAEAGRLATQPREAQLLPRIDEILAEVGRAADWVKANRHAVWDNVDRDGNVLTC